MSETTTLMINLDHPCYGVDVWEVAGDAERLHAIGQGYLPLEMMRALAELMLPRTTAKVIPDIKGLGPRRKALGLKLVEAEDGSGVSKATISRIERGGKAMYDSVIKLHLFYEQKEAGR